MHIYIEIVIFIVEFLFVHLDAFFTLLSIQSIKFYFLFFFILIVTKIL